MLSLLNFLFRLPPEFDQAAPCSPVSQELSLVAKIILHRINKKKYHSKAAELSANAQPDLACVIRSLVFPSSSVSSSLSSEDEVDSLMSEIVNHSIEVAIKGHKILLSALQHMISPSNCLATLAWANEHKIQTVINKAEEVALRSFSEAVKADVASLQLLTMESLRNLLASDELKVTGSEAEVLLSIIQWSNENPISDDSTLAQMVCDCVRSEWLTMAELEALDQHPLVVKSREATKIIASLYLGRLFNNSVLHQRSRTITKGPR